jgi:hypothetical protein
MDIVIIVVVGTLLLIGIVTYLMRKKMKQDIWEGELVNKQEVSSNSGDYDSTTYAIDVKLADGSSIRKYVPKKLFNQLQVGDQLLKAQGETHPRKI